jgi:AraC-like DNA-binding protein
MKTGRQRFQTRQLMMTSDFEIYHYFDRGMTSISLHHHDFYEVYLFLDGSVSYQIEGRNYELKPGDIVLINSRELHQAVIHDLSKPYERIVLWMNRSFIRGLSTDATDLALCFEAPNHKNVIRADVERQQIFRSLLNRLLALKGYTGFGQDLYPRTLITELLLIINEEMALIGQRQRVEVRKNRLIDGIIEYIANHLEEEIKIDDLAELFFLSKFHLCREFKNNTGTTLHRYIVQKKLIHAKELILEHLPITEVYQQSGFGDYSNFFRAFRNEYNMTPKQYYDRVVKGESTEN